MSEPQSAPGEDYDQAPWLTFLDDLRAVADIPALISEPGDRQRVMEVYQYAILSLTQAYHLIAASDPKAPFWDRFYVWPFHSHGASPDIVYYYTQIDEDGVYRFWGKRNTVHIMNLQIGTPTWGEGIEQGFTLTIDNYDIDDLSIGSDGAFEVIISAERPEGWTGDWWPLQQGRNAHSCWIRQIMNDWQTEKEVEINVERLDVKPFPRRRSADEIAQRMKDIVRYCVGSTRNWAKHIQKMRDKGLVNTLEYARLLDEGGYAAQAYWQGSYQIAPDEALIIHTKVPRETRYWNVQITDELYLPLDYPTSITSINGAQAHVHDGTDFYAVIADSDPGVPNWLDTGGYLSGSILGRWNRCSEEPIPDVRAVPLARVREFLPEGTPTVTREQREAAMWDRRRAYLDRVR